MTKNEIFKHLRKLLMEKFNLETGDVKMQSTFVDDFGADSLDLVDFVMAIEDEFGIRMDEDDTDNIKCVEDAVNYIYEALGGSADDEDVIEDDD
jgi:acyl carrier protein